MLSKKAVYEAQRLVEERAKVARAKWAYVSTEPNFSRRQPTGKVDEKLAWAIEEYRARQLAAIDARLRELGVDPSIEEEEEQDGTEPVVDAMSEEIQRRRRVVQKFNFK